MNLSAKKSDAEDDEGPACIFFDGELTEYYCSSEMRLKPKLL